MMKIKGICTAAALTLLLAGCGQQSASQAEYIGLDAAKTLALEAAGVSETAARFSATGMDSRNGMDYYTVDFSTADQAYEYDIDAVTGVVIDSNVKSLQSTDPSAAASSETPAAQQQTTAQTQTQQTQPTQQTQTAQQTQPAQQTAPAQNNTSGTITEAAAKQAALKHAGLSADQVTFIKCKLDWDDGRQEYEVEFYTADYKEYDYEIDATSGAVLSYDYDAESYSPPASSSGNAISADQAKQQALSQVPGATTSDIHEFEVDYDDGRLEYEGSIYYDGMEYEFTIDGYSGSIRSWEVEPIGH